MALERAPKYASLNMAMVTGYVPPAEKVYRWHVVRGPGDNLKRIAGDYGVRLENLIELNFPGSVENGRMIPEVVNWYLHHHSGFRCPETHDRKNRIFKGSEKIAIPYTSLVEIGPPIIINTKPVPLDGSAGETILAAQKFIWETRVPKLAPKDLGYLMAQARISVEGEVSQKGFVKVSFRKDQVKATLEHKFDEDFRGTFSTRFEGSKTLEPIVDAIKKGSKKDFARALFAPFEASLKQRYRFLDDAVAVVPEIGLEVSATPVVVRLAGEYEGPITIGAYEAHGKFLIKIGFNVGLSPKGWAWVVERVGAEALKRFLMSGGRALAGLWEYLVAEGIIAGAAIVAGTIAGTVAVIYLTAWICEDARHKGELKGLASWYVSAYKAKVFHLERPSGFITGDVKLRDKLVELGERDAVADARATLRKAGRQEANGTDAQALEAFGNILIANEGGKYDYATWRLENSLREKSQKLAGL